MAFLDLLIYGLLALAFLLFNLLPQWLKHRRERNDAAAAEPIPQPGGGLDAQWGRVPLPRARAPSAESASKHAPRTRAEQPVRPRMRQVPRLRSPKDLRDAIVLTAILGPCRAREPYGSKEP